ncbi:MAG TPA: LptA/OstA family protein [Gammaproteobacteria bacterium]
MAPSVLDRAARPLLVLCACLGAAVAASQEAEPEDLVVEAPGGARYNGATGRMEMTQLSITQGDLSITADRGSALEIHDGEAEVGIDYRLEGNVRLESALARITGDVAEFVARDGRLERFVLSGDPARFEDLDAERSGQAFGEAGRLLYDAAAGVVTLEGEVRVVVGPNEFRGCDLVYDLGAEEVSSGESECEQPLQIIRTAPDANGNGRQER